MLFRGARDIVSKVKKDFKSLELCPCKACLKDMKTIALISIAFSLGWLAKGVELSKNPGQPRQTYQVRAQPTVEEDPCAGRDCIDV